MQDGAEAEHEQFVAELRTPDTATLLGKYSLTAYALYQNGNQLEVVFKSEKPTIIPGFLRNKRMWPSFWEFEHPGETDRPTDKAEVFRWTHD